MINSTGSSRGLVAAIETSINKSGWFKPNSIYDWKLTVRNDSAEPAILRGQIEFQNDNEVVQYRDILTGNADDTLDRSLESPGHKRIASAKGLNTACLPV